MAKVTLVQKATDLTKDGKYVALACNNTIKTDNLLLFDHLMMEFPLMLYQSTFIRKTFITNGANMFFCMICMLMDVMLNNVGVSTFVFDILVAYIALI